MGSSFYVDIARNAIMAQLKGTYIDKDHWLSLHPSLAHQGATFVTLTIEGRLRGCIGSIMAHKPLMDDLISNAQSAAFHDPRFLPVSESEMDKVRVEVSLLTPPAEVTYRDAEELSHLIRPHVDGVIMRLGNHQATFLPQVWEELDDFELFFAHLGHKAGIGSDPLSYHPEIYTYQVEKYKEETDDA
ncbi:AmmeMemoRadiSam system protein A [Sulfuricurvum sp.]|uniref:AmmeMemoRadiSam system protein A n=1 Tax=Sulfuricurvum sp. TaxID=2025608 RepID=UPI003C5F6F58